MHNIATKKMAFKATLHCLLGCVIGELAGLEIGRVIGLENHYIVLLAGCLSFLSGYLVSTIPIVRSGVSFIRALRLVIFADTLSILTMVITDNLIMLAVPGAMNKDPLTFTYWYSRLISFTLAFFIAWPVNFWQLKKGKGHALTHQYHHSEHMHDTANYNHNHNHGIDSE